MLMPERSETFGSSGYRFAFNGYEREDDIAGQGSVIDFGMRVYDSRLGRFFSTDPIVFPYWSPYQYDANSPISIKDIDGMGPGKGTRRALKEDKKRLESMGVTNVKSTHYKKNGNTYYSNRGVTLDASVASINTYMEKGLLNKLKSSLSRADDFMKSSGEGGRAIGDFTSNIPVGLENYINSIDFNSFNPYLQETTHAFIDGDFEKFANNIDPGFIHICKQHEGCEHAPLPQNAAEAGQFVGAMAPMLLTRGKGRVSTRSLLRSAGGKMGLTNKGKIRFVPSASDIRNNVLSRTPTGGYIDKFGNVWNKPTGTIIGEPHWDVTLSHKGKEQLGHLSNSGSHINVTL
jgi:RHS repeat-associated protein